MPRPEKVAAVAEIKERIERAQAVFLAEYSGLSVKAQQDLRRGLRAQGAEFKVVKMTLTRRAAAELALDELDELLIGPTGIAFADGDPVNAAKLLKDFAASHEVFIIKGGLLGSSILSPERVKALAEIAPREVLLATLAGGLKAPLVAMAGLLAAIPRSAATVFQQLLEKKEGEAGTPSVEPDDAAAVPEAASEETPVDDATEAVATESAADSSTGDASDTEAAAAPADEEQEATAVDTGAADTANAEVDDATSDDDEDEATPAAAAVEAADDDQETADEAEEE